MSTRFTDTVGVIPARFQVDQLHSGHRYLIQEVRNRHQDVLVALGTTRGLPTELDPLPYEVRASMVQEDYPDIPTVKILDHPLDHHRWSRDLDLLIEGQFPGRSAILYGSRDSFIPKYTGKFETCALEAISETSGTSVRNSITFPNTREGRQAMIYLATHREPMVYRTVDLAIIDRERDRALFIGKDVHEGLISFMGGFDNKKGQTDEEAVMKELGEELPGLLIGELRKLDSLPVDDPRYRKSNDGIKTTMFVTDFRGGTFSAGDDANYYRWCGRTKFMGLLVPWHRPLGELLLSRWDG